jgi:transposase
MLLRRSEILAQIAAGKSNKWIAKHCGHGPDLIRRVRASLDEDPTQIFALEHALGAPRKISPGVLGRIAELTASNRRMSSDALARIISAEPEMPTISSSSVASARHELGYQFLPPSAIFPLTPDQKAKRLTFALAHSGTDWSTTVFTDESSFVLGTRGWLWRRKAETGAEVSWVKEKFPPKVMVFAGISRDYKSTLIMIESGTVDAESYVDEFVDQSGIIPDMNQRYGPRQWTYMQDGASVHTASATMEYLRAMVSVLRDWPAHSPDLNPIENLWAIMKRRVEQLQPVTKEDLMRVLVDVWESLEMDVVNALVASVADRMNLVVEKAGDRIPY